MIKANKKELAWIVNCCQVAKQASLSGWSRRILLAYERTLRKGLSLVPIERRYSLNWLIQKVNRCKIGESPVLFDLACPNFMATVEAVAPPERKLNGKIISNLIKDRRSPN